MIKQIILTTISLVIAQYIIRKFIFPNRTSNNLTSIRFVDLLDTEEGDRLIETQEFSNLVKTDGFTKFLESMRKIDKQDLLNSL